MSEEIVLVYDTDLKRPACVLLQAVYRADQHALLRFFPAEDWLVAPTPGMKRIAGTAEEWKRAAAITERARREAKGE